jgi:hypothetical protein
MPIKSNSGFVGGSPSYPIIEPCASLPALISDAFLRTFASFGSRPKGQCDRLASPAGEPFPDGLDHLPLAGAISSVSVTSSPSFGSFVEQQQGQLSGAAMTTR